MVPPPTEHAVGWANVAAAVEVDRVVHAARTGDAISLLDHGTSRGLGQFMVHNVADGHVEMPIREARLFCQTLSKVHPNP